MPPENRLSLPTMDGEMVEKVVPLAAREEIVGAPLGYRFDVVLTDSARLLTDTGLDNPDRSERASSIMDLSAFLWIVDRVAGPRPL